MQKILNIFFLIIILLFFFSVFKYYSSNKNIKNINLNRLNFEDNIKTKTKELPILEDNTNDVVEFNDKFLGENVDDPKRNFWNLLKIK